MKKIIKKVSCFVIALTCVTLMILQVGFTKAFGAEVEKNKSTTTVSPNPTESTNKNFVIKGTVKPTESSNLNEITKQTKNTQSTTNTGKSSETSKSSATKEQTEQVNTDTDLTAPEIKAYISCGILTIEVESQKDIKEIFVNENIFTDFVDNKLEIRLQKSDNTIEQFKIIAVDIAGTKSDVCNVTNPYYSSETDELVENANASKNSEAKGTVTDSTKTATNADGKKQGKEFYTIQTDTEKIFYLIVDKDKTIDNVYLLTEVSGNDLLNFVDDDTKTLNQSEETSSTESIFDKYDLSKNTEDEENSDTQNSQNKEKSNNSIYLIIIIVIAGAAIFFYIKKVKNIGTGKNESYDFDDDDYDGTDEENEVMDDEESKKDIEYSDVAYDDEQDYGDDEYDQF